MGKRPDRSEAYHQFLYLIVLKLTDGLNTVISARQQRNSTLEMGLNVFPVIDIPR